MHLLVSVSKPVVGRNFTPAWLGITPSFRC